VVVLSEMRDTLGLIMLSQGVDISSSDWGADQFNAALDVLDEHVSSGQIGAIKGNSYTDDLYNGDAVVGIVWSGDVQSILNYELEAAGEDPRFEFVIPDSGGTLWSDNFVAPTGTTRVGNVEKLIDYYYQPDVAAELAAWVNYISPVVGAKEAILDIAPELAENQLIFPDDETLSQVKVFRSLDATQEQQFSADFQRILLGA
jgi:spermidine/putrescine transport system substrate-binding protein